MAKIINRALSVGYAGKSKVGKSYLSANFCKLDNKPSGIVFDFSRIFMTGGFDGSTPKYLTSEKMPVIQGADEIIEVGEAYPACEKVGLDMDNQYKLILKWQDFLDALEFARYYQDTIKRQKLWLVLDDMVGLRWHKVINISINAKHKSVSKDDWKVASSELKLLISQLSKEFNLVLVNQMGAAYENGDSTGISEPKWIPGGAEYLYDILFELGIDDNVAPRKQFAKIMASREIWQCDESFDPMVYKPTPETILNRAGITPNRW